MTRRSYNACQAEWEARNLPLLRSLYGSDPAPETIEALSSFAVHCQRLFGAVPQSDSERYAAEAAIESQQCVVGRGED